MIKYPRGGRNMIKDLMAKLVLDVVLSVVGDEAERLSLASDFDVLDVDQLAITYIVLALESRLGIELPSHLEDARTVAELIAGAQAALQQAGTTKCRLPYVEPLSFPAGRAAARQSAGRALCQLSQHRPRRQSLSSRGVRY
jgi:acyl carrier protein